MLVEETLHPSLSVTYAVSSIADVEDVERTVTELPFWLESSPFNADQLMFAQSPSIVAVTIPELGQTED
jgi:hypothetical protein